jgi:hypothetical protein
MSAVLDRKGSFDEGRSRTVREQGSAPRLQQSFVNDRPAPHISRNEEAHPTIAARLVQHT